MNQSTGGFIVISPFLFFLPLKWAKAQVSSQLKLKFFFHSQCSTFSASPSFSIACCSHFVISISSFLHYLLSPSFVFLELASEPNSCFPCLTPSSMSSSAFLLQNNLVSSYLQIFYFILYLLLPSPFLIFLLFFMKSLFFTLSLCYNFSPELVFWLIYRFRRK